MVRTKGFSSSVRNRLASFLDDESGATAMEYTLIVGLISFAILLTVTAIGRVIDENVFTVVATAASNV